MNKEQSDSPHFLPLYQPFQTANEQQQQKPLKRSYDEMSGMYMGGYHPHQATAMMHPQLPPNNRIFYRQPYTTSQSPIHLFHPAMSHFQPLHLKQQLIVQEPVFPKFPPQNFDIPDISSSNSVYGDTSYGSSPLSPSTNPTSRQSSYACISTPSSSDQASLDTQQELNPQFNNPRWNSQPPVPSTDSSPVSQSEENQANNFESNLPFITAQQQQQQSQSSATPQQTTKATSGFEAAAVKPVLPPKKTRSPKKRKRKDPNEPQKPVSAYSLFFRNAQAAIKSQNPSATFGDVSKIVAAMWDNLADDIKNYYKRQMEMAKKEYLKQLAIYRSSLATKESQGATNSNEATATQEGAQEDKTTEEISSTSLSQDQNVSTTTNCPPPTVQQPESDQQQQQQQQHSPAQLSPGLQLAQQQQQQQSLMAKNFMSPEVAPSGRYMMMPQYPQQHFNQPLPFMHPLPPQHHQLVQSARDDHVQLMCNIMNYNQIGRMEDVIGQPQNMYTNFNYLTEGYDFVPMETFNRNAEANLEQDETLKIT